MKEFYTLQDLRKGDVIGVACDVKKGTMQISINGGAFLAVFSSGVSTGPVVGSDFFPIVAGARKTKVRLNLGADAFLPFRYAPPDTEYLVGPLRAIAESLVSKVC